MRYIDGRFLAMGGKAQLTFGCKGTVSLELNALSCIGTRAEVSRDCSSQGVMIIVGIDVWELGITTGVSLYGCKNG